MEPDSSHIVGQHVFFVNRVFHSRASEESTGDDRRPDQLWPVKLEPGYTRWAEGYTLITQGETVVLCNATVKERLPPWMQRSTNGDRGWVTAEYSMLPRSARPHHARNHARRPHAGGPPIDRPQPARHGALGAVGQATDHRGLRRLQADGGTRTAATTGGYVAPALALQNLVAAGIVPPEALLSPVAAVNVGVVDGEPLLDLCYEETSTPRWT